jgi:hypothetical protein
MQFHQAFTKSTPAPFKLGALIHEHTPGDTVPAILLRVLANPWKTIIVRWNWKSAVFSSLIRGHIFFLVTLRSGWRAAAGAMLAEFAYRALTSGFYGALTQALRAAEPAWAGAIATMILLPLCSHVIEFFVHFLRHTPHLAANIITSLIFTAVSTLFNWYAMRKSALITGPGARSVGADLRAMPRLILAFVAAAPVALWKGLRRWFSLESAWPAVLHESEDAASD